MLTRSALEPVGLFELKPGFDNAYFFAVDGVAIQHATSIKFVVKDVPELSRLSGVDLPNKKRKQIETIGETFCVRWSRHEEDVLRKYSGKPLVFHIEYELDDERISYAEGVMEIDEE